MPRHITKFERRTKDDIEASDYATMLLIPKEQFIKAVNNGINTIGKLREHFQVPSLAIRNAAWIYGYLKEEDV